MNMAADGTVQTVWTGLTMASGIAIGNDGALYATELASGRKRRRAEWPPGAAGCCGRASASPR